MGLSELTMLSPVLKRIQAKGEMSVSGLVTGKQGRPPWSYGSRDRVDDVSCLNHQVGRAVLHKPFQEHEVQGFF